MDICLKDATNSDSDAKYIEKKEKNIKQLCHDCPQLERIRKIDKESFFQNLIDRVFVHDSPCDIYVRNRTENSNKNIRFSIRLVAPNDFIKNFFGDNKTLIFNGTISAGKAYINKIEIALNSPKKDFEGILNITPREKLQVVPFKNTVHNNYTKDNYDDNEKNSFLNFVSGLPAIIKITNEKLQPWQDYINWKRTIAEKNTHGAKYYNFEFNKKNEHITFSLVFENEEDMQKARRYLKRDVYAYNNVISSDRWIFNFDRRVPQRYYTKIELGRLCSFNIIGPVKNDNDNNNHKSNKNNSNYDNEDNGDNGDGDDIRQTNDYKLRASFSDKNYKDNEIARYFTDTAFIAKVTYELCDDDAELLKSFNENDENDESYKDSKEYIEKITEIINRFPNNGFIANSQVGEFALLRRFEDAIKDLCNGNAQSNISQWLFDIKLASLPLDDNLFEVKDWGDKNIENNEHQRLAVQKALTAPEVFLLQGPPGTGKTTVIAEIAHQLVKQNNRVLISSQSNDAVDNALDRLQNIPEIRAIRFGTNAPRSKRYSDDCKYSENNALHSYYKSISTYLKNTYTQNYLDTQKSLGEYDKDLRDINNHSLHLDAINKNITDKTNEHNKIISKINNIKQTNNNKGNATQQMSQILKLESRLIDGVNSDDDDEDYAFFLNNENSNFILGRLQNILQRLIVSGLVIPSNFTIFNLGFLDTITQYFLSNGKTLNTLKNEWDATLKSAIKDLKNNLNEISNIDNSKALDALVAKKEFIDSEINEKNKKKISIRNY